MGETKLARWTAIGIVATGLVLMSIQLGAQVYIDLQAARVEKPPPCGSTHIGFVILLIGAVLMAVLSMSGGSRAKG